VYLIFFFHMGKCILTLTFHISWRYKIIDYTFYF